MKNVSISNSTEKCVDIIRTRLVTENVLLRRQVYCLVGANFFCFVMLAIHWDLPGLRCGLLDWRLQISLQSSRLAPTEGKMFIVPTLCWFERCPVVLGSLRYTHVIYPCSHHPTLLILSKIFLFMIPNL